VQRGSGRFGITGGEETGGGLGYLAAALRGNPGAGVDRGQGSELGELPGLEAKMRHDSGEAVVWWSGVTSAAQGRLHGGAVRARWASVWGGAIEVGMGRRAAAWGFKGEGQGLGVRARDEELAGDLGVTGERGTREGRG
jgi:hypothetical protein